YLAGARSASPECSPSSAYPPPQMGGSEPLRVRFDAFELDEANAMLARDRQPVALPPKAFAVLCALARQPGQLVVKNALLDGVGAHRPVSESALKTTISERRAALADDAKQPRYIETVSRRGYRFIGLGGAPGAEAPIAMPISPAPAASPIVGRKAAMQR